MPKYITHNAEIILLMTGTVDPNKMYNTKLTNVEERRRQYLNAIDFYLNNTNLKIIFCENTGHDLYSEIKNKKKETRLEYLTFHGNNYFKELGKGFGEKKILEYIFNKSKLIKYCKYIIKVTGRVIIININEIIQQIKLNKNRIGLQLRSYNFAESVCFYCPKNWLYINLINYNQPFDKFGHNFEYMLSYFLVTSPEMKIQKITPIVIGISGTYNRPYENLSIIQRNINHYNSLFQIYSLQGKNFYSLVYKIRWIMALIERKLILSYPLNYFYSP